MRFASPSAAAVLAASSLVASLALAAPPRPAPRGRAAPPARGYQAAVQRWHEAPPGATAPRDDSGRPMLVLVALNTGERTELRAESDDGGFDAAALDRASELLREPRTGLRHPVEPSLLDIVYRAQRRFEAPEIRAISGYRAPKPGGHSNHGRGRAMDLVVPGASDDAVATWARGLGFAGVGIYPKSGFCHLDVRPQSHFWVDASGPGQRSRETPVRGGLAAKADQEARKRNARAIPPFVLPSSDVDGVWRGKASAAAPAEESGEDEDETPR